MFRDEYKMKYDSVAPDPAFRLRLEERIEEMQNKKRSPMLRRTAVVVLAAMLALITAGFATGAFRSIFSQMMGVFANGPTMDYEHMEQAARNSEEMQSVRFESGAEIEVGLAQSYYNGQQLALGWTYIADDTEHRFFDRESAPQELGEDVANMVNIVDLIGESNFAEFQRRLDEQGWVGVEWYDCYLSDHVYLADAQKVMGEDGQEHVSGDALFYPQTSHSWTAEDGLNISCEEYETPLPEAAQDKDSLTIARKASCRRCWLVAEGDKVYTGRDPAERVELMFEIVRSEDYVETTCQKEVQLPNHTAKIELTRTPIRAEFTVTNLISDEWKRIWSGYGGYLNAPLNLEEDVIFDYEILVDGEKVNFSTDSYAGAEGMSGWFLMPADAQQVTFRPVYANSGAHAGEDVTIDLTK